MRVCACVWVLYGGSESACLSDIILAGFAHLACHVVNNVASCVGYQRNPGWVVNGHVRRHFSMGGSKW